MMNFEQINGIGEKEAEREMKQWKYIYIYILRKSEEKSTPHQLYWGTKVWNIEINFVSKKQMKR